MAQTAASIAPWADEVVVRPGPVSIEVLERLPDDDSCYELVATARSPWISRPT
jgi:hypothetical protein